MPARRLIEPARPDLVATAIVPDRALGLAFHSGGLLRPRYAGDAFVGQRGRVAAAR